MKYVFDCVTCFLFKDENNFRMCPNFLKIIFKNISQVVIPIVNLFLALVCFEGDAANDPKNREQSSLK